MQSRQEPKFMPTFCLRSPILLVFDNSTCTSIVLLRDNHYWHECPFLHSTGVQITLPVSAMRCLQLIFTQLFEDCRHRQVRHPYGNKCFIIKELLSKLLNEWLESFKLKSIPYGEFRSLVPLTNPFGKICSNQPVLQ